MKNIVKFIVFLIYVVSVFFVDIKVLWIFCVVNFLLALIFKINIKKMFFYIKKFLPFIIFTILINIILGGLKYALIMGFRIMIAYVITYFFSQSLTTLELAETIKKLFMPLKIFKINTDDIEIMVIIAICMIPVLKNEISTTINSLKSKGSKFGIKSLPLVIKPLIISIMRRTGEVEKGLILKNVEMN